MLFVGRYILDKEGQRRDLSDKNVVLNIEKIKTQKDRKHNDLGIIFLVDSYIRPCIPSLTWPQSIIYDTQFHTEKMYLKTYESISVS